MSFKDKVVLITGASSGIGAGIALEFANHGANLVIGGRNVEQLQETKNNCIKAGLKDNQVVLVIGNIEEERVVKEFVNAAITNFNQIDVLVNNAGFSLNTPAIGSKIEDFDRVYNVNLRAAIALTLEALPHLIKTKGNVINISSICSWVPITGSLAYCISKAGMDMFTKSLAFEVAPQGVRVNSINPGGVPTNITRTMNLQPDQEKEMWDSFGKYHPLGRVGDVKEIADAALFLASDKSSFVTGQMLAVDGGIGLGGVSF
jgi:NAD(P)-dependent dehydrogenase (short-subunit alcohol dehydrogenase family)